jgi:hypothetical protein
LTAEDAPSVPSAPAPEERCIACGAALQDDQEWCLECGAARTLLERPPDWRVPAALAAVLVAVIVLGLLIALVSLSIQANHP